MEARCVNVTDNRMRRQKFLANAPQVELEVVQIVRKGLDIPEAKLRSRGSNQGAKTDFGVFDIYCLEVQMEALPQPEGVLDFQRKSLGCLPPTEV